MLVELVYELLDAHEDTARIADSLGHGGAVGTSPDQEPWAAHLDYLRQLQRVGREMLAGVA
jgi:hypothetical protein